MFDSIILLIIWSNCIILATDDPTTNVQDEWQLRADIIFQMLYTIEVIVKILGLGLLFNKGAYLRDPWNVIDFIIVGFGYLQYLKINNGGYDLRTLRVIRVFRPLRKLNQSKG